MADKRINELNALTITASTDEALISDTSASETKKVTIENLFKTPYVGTPQALSGAGTANITAPITNCTSTGAAQVIALANGAQGQVKICSHTTDGGSYVELDAVGDTVVLLFNDSAWQIIGGHGYTVA